MGQTVYVHLLFHREWISVMRGIHGPITHYKNIKFKRTQTRAIKTSKIWARYMFSKDRCAGFRE